MTTKLTEIVKGFKNKPHEINALNWLETKIPPSILVEFADKYSTEIPAKPAFNNTTEKILTVPYFYQLDNQSGQGNRECFSSSSAMVAAFYGKVNTDDEYNAIRRKFGATTDSSAQLKALQSLGLKAKFITNGNAYILENEIRNNRPVACGWLHHGTPSKPTGGGHWGVICGFTPTHFVVHDPFGEGDMVNGGYTNNTQVGGKNIRYSKKNWLPRWEVDGSSTGWAILVSR